MQEKNNSAKSNVGGSLLNIDRQEKGNQIIYRIFDTTEGQNYTFVLHKGEPVAKQHEPSIGGRKPVVNFNDKNLHPAQQYVFMHNEYLKSISA